MRAGGGTVTSRSQWRWRLLCGAASALLAVSPAPAKLKEAPAVRDLLGDDCDGAKLVVTREDGIGLLDLASGKYTQLARFGADSKFWGLSAPQWSPDGSQILVAYQGKAYVVASDGSGRRQVIEHVERLHSPNWWLDPETGELCYTYKDSDGKHWYGKDKDAGHTWLYRPRSRKTVKLADFPCDGQLSFDGTHLTEAYGGCLIVDVKRQKYYPVYHGGQSCNSTTSPDNTYRIMHLYLPHEYFGIRDKHDKELWKIPRPAGSSEWQGPRWSNHVNFATCMARYGRDYKPSIIRISDKKVVVLRSVGGSWGVSHLFLPSAARVVGRAAAAPVSQAGPLDGVPLGKEYAGYRRKVAEAECWTPIIEELRSRSVADAKRIVEALETAGRKTLAEADPRQDARQAEATYKQVAARFAGHEIGRQAVAALAAAALKKELAAADAIEALERLAAGLQPVDRGVADFSNPQFLARNQGKLVRIVHLLDELRRNHAGTGAAARAEAIARRCRISDAPAGEKEKLVVVATVEAASTVPDPQTKLYDDLVTYVRYKVDKVLSGTYGAKRLVAVYWGFRGRKLYPAAGYKPGMRHKLTLDLFDAHAELESINTADDANDIRLVPYWVSAVEDAK